MTVTDLFEKYKGTMEYNGVVRDIQVWFYGELLKMSWCATSISYFMNELGLLSQIGGKNENVCQMMLDTEKTCKKTGVGRFFRKADIPKGYEVPRGTVAFMLWNGTMRVDNPNKHVTSVERSFEWKGSGKFKALGGNQSDGILSKDYNQGNVYAIFIPDYKDEPRHRTLRRGDHGYDVTELQIDLNGIGYPDASGNALAIDGLFGRRTEEAVKRLQKYNRLEVDGICGPKTWVKIDEILNAAPKYVRVLTDVYVRSAPNKVSAKVGIIREGAIVIYSIADDGWLYLPRWNGWITSKKDFVKIV